MTPVVSLRPLAAQADGRLVELVRAGNERAFEALTRRYRRQLLIYANRLLGSEGRAEDALQQALMQAWIALRDGAEVGEVRPWLYRIVHNSAVTMLRRARHDTVELNEAIDAAAPDGGPESRLVLKEIFAGISLMPEPQRQAILLTAVGGNSHGEAAAALGLSDGAVRGLVYRARTALRQAAAAVSPVGLWNWAAGLGGRRTPLAGDAGDVAGAAGTATGAAVLMKGGAILAAAGAVAGAGQAVLPTLAGPGRHTTRVAHHATRAPSPVHAAGAALVAPPVLAGHRTAAQSLVGGEHRGRGGNLAERHRAGADRTSGRVDRDGSGSRGSDGARSGPSVHRGGGESGSEGPSGRGSGSSAGGSSGGASGDGGSGRGGSSGDGRGGGAVSGSGGSGGSGGSSGSSGPSGSGGSSGSSGPSGPSGSSGSSGSGGSSGSSGPSGPSAGSSSGQDGTAATISSTPGGTSGTSGSSDGGALPTSPQSTSDGGSGGGGHDGGT